MAEQKVAEEVEEDGTVLVMVAANDDGACSVMFEGWEAMPSNDSVRIN